MPSIRVASFNVEWMNDWFNSDAQQVALKPTFTKDNHTNDTVTTGTRTAAVIHAIDPDILALQEAPSRGVELELSISTFLSTGGAPEYDFLIGDSGKAQKLAILYKPATVQSVSLVPHSEVADVVDSWLADVDGDALLEDYSFTRTPLIADAIVGGHTLRVIALHTKSNFVNQGRQMWEDPATRQNYVVEALKSRRRNSTEGMRLRSYLNALLDKDLLSKVIVLGGLNDGPGTDYFEANYLSHNVTDILIGSAFRPEQVFAHAQHDVAPEDRFTAIFDDFVTNTKDAHLLLDHVLLSPGLLASSGLRRIPGSGAIHHAEYDAQVVNDGQSREDRPSDHRPVSVRLEF